MENIQTLLKKDRMDACLLGMESLALVTDGCSSNPHIAREASNAVIVDGVWQDVKTCIFGIVMDCNERHGAGAEEESESDVVLEERDAKLRLALTITGNALAVAVACERKSQDRLGIDVDEMKDLMATLHMYMKEQEKGDESLTLCNVQNVYQAARCVWLLIDLSQELKSTAIGLGVLEVANNYILGGMCRHQLLGSVSERIVSCLNEDVKR